MKHAEGASEEATGKLVGILRKVNTVEWLKLLGDKLEEKMLVVTELRYGRAHPMIRSINGFGVNPTWAQQEENMTCVSCVQKQHW